MGETVGLGASLVRLVKFAEIVLNSSPWQHCIAAPINDQQHVLTEQHAPSINEECQQGNFYHAQTM